MLCTVGQMVCVLHRAVYSERMVSLEQPLSVEGIAEMVQRPCAVQK